MNSNHRQRHKLATLFPPGFFPTELDHLQIDLPRFDDRYLIEYIRNGASEVAYPLFCFLYQCTLQKNSLPLYLAIRINDDHILSFFWESYIPGAREARPNEAYERLLVEADMYHFSLYFGSPIGVNQMLAEMEVFRRQIGDGDKLAPIPVIFVAFYTRIIEKLATTPVTGITLSQSEIYFLYNLLRYYMEYDCDYMRLHYFLLALLMLTELFQEAITTPVLLVREEEYSDLEESPEELETIKKEF